MGRMSAEELLNHSDLTLVCGVEHPEHPEIGQTIGGAIVIADGESLPESDVWVDFSLAGPAIMHARRAAEENKPLLLAVTGFSPAEEEEVEWLARLCPILAAPNLSAGMGAMEYIAAAATRLLPESFDAVISETHHRTKKDAPSGTAKRLSERMARFGPKPEIFSIRAGMAVGEHRVQFIGQDEELILIHRAWSRRAFSSGIPRAVRFLFGRSAGLYTLEDIYELD